MKRAARYSQASPDEGRLHAGKSGEMPTLPDVRRPTTKMRLPISDAASAAAADEIMGRYVGHGNAWKIRCHTGCGHTPRKSRFRLKRSRSLAVRPGCGRESHDQYQPSDAAHRSSRRCHKDFKLEPRSSIATSWIAVASQNGSGLVSVSWRRIVGSGGHAGNVDKRQGLCFAGWRHSDGTEDVVRGCQFKIR